MGEAYLGEGSAGLALTHYQKAVEKDPKYAPAYSGLGDAYRQLRDADKAAGAYRRALELRPDYHLIHFKLGLLFESSDPAAAIKHFENYAASAKNAEFRQDAIARLEKLKAAKP
jgi:Tfp pilus assembly protein PilF